jgi:hypothetical protein
VKPYVLAAWALLAACGEQAAKPTPVPPAPPPQETLRPSTRPPDDVRGDAPKSVTISQVMLVYRFPDGSQPPRTREQAYALALSLIQRAQDGAPFETLLPYSDDKDEHGLPYNGGSVSLARHSPALPVVKQAAFETPVGQVHPRPIDAGTAFLVIRRDA